MLTTDAQERKAIPVYSGFIKYFPLAMAAVAECSKAGNDQHNPGKPLHWDRSKSGDELDALLRHLMEAGTIDTDGIRHSTKAAWRAMANLQKELEAANAQIPIDTFIPGGVVPTNDLEKAVRVLGGSSLLPGDGTYIGLTRSDVANSCGTDQRLCRECGHEECDG